MVLWLPFDETNGTTSANLVPGGNNGTQVGGPTVTNGYVDHSLNFNGTNQYVTVPDYPAINPGTGNLSIDAWVRRATDSGAFSTRVIVDKRDPVSYIGYSFVVYSGNLLFQMTSTTSGNINYLDTATIPADNQWHFVGVTVSRTPTNSVVQFYVDGAPTGAGSRSISSSLNNTTPLLVGSSPVSGADPWKGGIDEVEVFNRALAGNEIASIFNAGPAGKCKTPVCVPVPAKNILWLPFDETNGTISANFAPSSISGTQVGNPVVTNGYVDHSLSFNGTNQYVTVPSYSSITIGTGDLTIDAWIRRYPNSGTSPRIIVDKRDPQTGIGYSLAVYNGNLLFQMGDGAFNNSNYVGTNTVPADNQWHFVAVTVSRHATNGGSFYLDGVPSGIFDPTGHAGSFGNTDALMVGNTLVTAGLWMGGIDEVEIFSRALASSEIATLFNAGSAGKCKNPCTVQLIVNCPTNKVVECGTTWSFDPPTATGTGVTITPTGLETHNTGCTNSMTQHWLVTDACHNTNTCTQTVTVVDTTKPVITCATNTIYITLNSNCNLVIPQISHYVSDNCTPAYLSTNFTEIPPANTIITNSHSQLVTLGLMDACGNSNDCQVMVVGLSPKPKIVIFPSGVTATNCLVPNVLPQVFATLPCTASNLVYTQWPTNGTTIAAGISGITVTVFDPANTNSSASVFITLTGQQSFMNNMFNTGVNNNHALLPVPSVDPHYTLGPVPASILTGSGAYNAPKAIVAGPWGITSPLSRWINPGTNAWPYPPIGYGGYPVGAYIYTNQFTLPAGADPASAVIQGRWAADDRAAMYFNGLAPANKVPYPVLPPGFSSWTTPFIINTGFIPGVNTLYFIVTNTSVGYTGLRVEFNSAQINCSTCAPPSISLNIQNLLVQSFNLPPGGSATFHAGLVGTPPLTIQWYRNGLPLVNGGHYSGVNTPYLTVSPVATNDAGAYSIFVSNPCGSYAVTNGSLKVINGWGPVGPVNPFPWAHWHFAVPGNPMKADIGPDLMLDGTNIFGISSGTTDDYGLPGVGGQIVNVMDVPPLPGDTYIQLPFFAPTNTSSVSNYTLAMDVYVPTGSMNPVTLFELSNPDFGGQDGIVVTISSNVPVNGGTALSVHGTLGGLPFEMDSSMLLILGQWNRIVLVVNGGVTAAGIFDQANAGTLTSYLNGAPVGSMTFDASYGALAFNPTSLATLLSSPEGTAGESYVSSIEFFDAALPSETIAEFGSPDSGPVPSERSVRRRRAAGHVGHHVGRHGELLVDGQFIQASGNAGLVQRPLDGFHAAL